MLSEDEGQRGNPPAEVEALRAELVRIREEKKLTLDSLTRDSGISRSTWHRVLKGESFPTREALERSSRRLRLDTDHLLRLWEAADAALKRAAERTATSPAPMTTTPITTTSVPAPDAAPGTAHTANNTPPPAPDQTPAAAADTTPPAPVTEAAPFGFAVSLTREEPAANVPPVPAAVPSGQPVVSATASPAESGPAGQTPGLASPSETSRSEGAVVQPAAAARAENSTQAATGPTVKDIGVVRTDATRAPVTKTGRIAKLLITFLALTVVLLIGRFAAMSDHPKNDTAVPEATSAGSEDEDTSAPPVGQAPPDKTPPASQAATSAPQASPPVTAATTTAPAPTTAPTSAQLGAEGRTVCAHYKPKRRVILAKGMVGTNVAQVQCLLNHNYDYALVEDGKFGAETEAGVKAIQRCSGIDVDGKVGPDTWKYLDYPKPGCGH